ncbi:MAG: transcription-repair coupling factor [Clostridiaceae bacterium]|nr:transcription-repair coupling factor [Clostridiaceae bacterium]
MNEIISDLQKLPKFQEYVQEIKEKKGPVTISGLSDVGKIQFICATKQEINQPICIVTYNEIQARKIIEDLKYFSKDFEEIYYFPKREIVTYDYIAESKDLPYERIEVLNKIQKKNAKVIVTTIEAIMQKMITKTTLYKNKITLEIGKNYNIEDIKQKLVSLGYERNDLVENKGQFSVRGDIIDVAISEKEGIRVEFWGDEIDSIRKFYLSSQRSSDMENKIEIMPAHEFVLEEDLNTIIKKIKNDNIDLKREIENKIETKQKTGYIEALKEIKEKDIEIIEEENYISKVDKYFDYFYKKQSNFFDYLQNDFIILFDEFSKIKQREENIIIENRNLIKTLIEKQKYIPQAIQEINKIEYTNENKQIIYLEKQDFGLTKSSSIKYIFNYRDVKYYKSEIEILLEDIKKWQNSKKQVIILAGNKEETEKFSKLLQDKDINYTIRDIKNNIKAEEKNKENWQVILDTGKLSSGFESYDLNLIVVTGEELFLSSLKNKRKVSQGFKQGEKVVFADLKVGDYVVHKSHGIGQFIGVNTLKADGIIKDYIKLRYSNDDMLYIPTNDLDNIRKYIGGRESSPKINKLGGKEWENTKQRVKNNLKEVARDLMELYAKRQKIKGFSFSKDTDWQRQFEDDFPYVETDDQLRCIEETKKDMEDVKPMDRLLCGDVGYGKTEVAIRAAFKAIMDQKQVAYLVPTTVLANQQYETFKSRMENFAIRVELLNRFRTKKQQDEIVRKLKLGEIDVVIGTHRILSKDVEFKDLGLLIIDEEHRFGVKDKEKIKKYKTNIDVLTMTATPIPRTLHMSIVGVRDMSVIYEPPQNRRPVQTYVLEYDEEVIKEAITKELERKGQVFYLFNKVEGIEKKAIQIENLVPEAKVAYAHGKMSGTELEEMMMEFVKGEINVLVCTTILESGIDIPNANTIIVENADRLGLAQLYQIRGRVGRADKQAYAYITYKRDKILTEVADKRLKAIKEFTEFGSGFKIAMRDLEIRGAGSLLGEIQHGHMEEVGYDTYCKLLDEVLKEMQGIETIEEQDVQIDLTISSYIPEEYIENSSQKIEIYQDIALCRSDEDIQNVTDEIIDRYGQMPIEIENLLKIATIKNLARKANILKIAQKRDGIVFLYDINKFDMSLVDILLKNYNRRVRFSPGREPYITFMLQGKNDKEKLKEIENFLLDNIK